MHVFLYAVCDDNLIMMMMMMMMMLMMMMIVCVCVCDRMASKLQPEPLKGRF